MSGKVIIRNIENGPSADRIFMACKYAYDDNARVEVKFEIAEDYFGDSGGARAHLRGVLEDVRITSIKHEDRSGHSFNLTGYCKTDFDKNGNGSSKLVAHSFTAFYNAKIRKGTMVFKN